MRVLLDQKNQAKAQSENRGRGKLIKISNSNSSGKSVESPMSEECAPNLKGTVSRTKTKAFSNAGRLRFFLQNWQKLTTDFNSRDSSIEASSEGQTLANKRTQRDTNVPNREKDSRQGYIINANERSPEGGTAFKGPVSLNDFFQTAKKGRKHVSANYKLKTPQCPHAIHPFQDGGDEKCSRSMKLRVTIWSR